MLSYENDYDNGKKRLGDLGTKLSFCERLSKIPQLLQASVVRETGAHLGFPHTNVLNGS